MRPFIVRTLSLATLLCGLATLAGAQNPGEHGGGPFSEGVSSQGGATPGVSTGDGGLDILLNARMNNLPANVLPQASAASEPGGVLMPSGREGITSESSAQSLRDAMMREAAAFADKNNRVNDSSQQKRMEANLQTRSEATLRVASTADDDVEARRAVASGGFTKGLLRALRDYRYLILGLALLVVALVWGVSSRAQGRGGSAASASGHRGRR